MLAAARATFEGRVSAGGGRGTASEHYIRFAKAGVPGYILPPEDEQDEVPDDFRHLLVWHREIRNRTPRGEMGIEPITLPAIDSYERWLLKVGIEMDALDFELLCRIDDIWLEVAAETLKR